MKFTLSTTRYFYTEEEAIELKDLGFEFVKTESKRLTLSEPSSVDINTLEELVAFVEKYGVIVFYPKEIEIYNGYRE